MPVFFFLVLVMMYGIRHLEKAEWDTTNRKVVKSRAQKATRTKKESPETRQIEM
jgi:hypothetical protein